MDVQPALERKQSTLMRLAPLPRKQPLENGELHAMDDVPSLQRKQSTLLSLAPLPPWRGGDDLCLSADAASNGLPLGESLCPVAAGRGVGPPESKATSLQPIYPALRPREEAATNYISEPKVVGVPDAAKDIEAGHHFSSDAWGKDRGVGVCAELVPRLPDGSAGRPALMDNDDLKMLTSCGGGPSRTRIGLMICVCVILVAGVSVGVAVGLRGSTGVRSSACPLEQGTTSRHGVKMVVSFSYSRDEFEVHKSQFVTAVAETLAIHECLVKNVSVAMVAGRRLLASASACNVEFKVLTFSAEDAAHFASSLSDVTKLNENLEKKGLTPATIVQAPSTFQASSAPTGAPATSIPGSSCSAGSAWVNGACTLCAVGTFREERGPAECSVCEAGKTSARGSSSVAACQTVWITLTELQAHSSTSSCWVVVHSKVLDVTSFRSKHPGGADKMQCGTDLTSRFEMQHGPLSNLIRKLAGAFAADLKLVGSISLEQLAAAVPDHDVHANAANATTDATEFDFSQVVKKPHPGNGNEFKTLVYVELKGAWDGASGFVNIKNTNEIHLWCSKRPTLSQEYCSCSSNDNPCSQFELKTGTDKKVFPLKNTDGYLGMTDLLASGETSWLPLWDAGKMSVVPGVGRADHGRSHFLVKDAAAKGVSIDLEQSTNNGWLAKAIFAYNNLYCKVGQAQCPPTTEASTPSMVDGISFAQAAAGPNALEASEAIASHGTFFHFTGVKNVDTVVTTEVGFDYKNPFASMMSMMRRRSWRPESYRDDDVLQQSRLRTDEDMWAENKINLGLADLLAKEEVIFKSLGILKDKLDGYLGTIGCSQVDGSCAVSDKCPSSSGDGSGFPSLTEWADDESDSEIGMQLRAVAILMANGVQPKVFQVQQTRYDTHSNQGPRVKQLLSDLKTGVFTFVKAAENCGFFDDVVVSTFTDFGRRLAENSRRGTDHGWGTYNVVFGKGLRAQVLGYNEAAADASQKSALAQIIPMHANAYSVKEAKGDLTMTTDLETWNACLLNALALPALPRLGRCPSELHIRSGLNTIPMFDETLYYKTVPGQNVTSSNDVPSAPNNGGSSTSMDTSHMQTVLSRTQVLHFARRTGFSVKSLGLDAYFMPNFTSSGGTSSRRSSGPILPTLTLQEAVTKVLSDENVVQTAGKTAEVFINYVPRLHNVIKLWSSERRQKRNNWKDIMQIPYPRNDTIRHRLKRWGIESFFDMSSVVDNDLEGSIAVKPEYIGREDEILQALRNNVTQFFTPQTVDKAKDKFKNNLASDEVNWYRTIMYVPDVKEIVAVTFEKIVNDWKCVNGTHPDDSSVPCDTKCDLRNLLTIDYNAKTAMLTDTRARGDDNTKNSAPWKILQNCLKTQDNRKTFEIQRYNVVKSKVRGKSIDMYVNDMTNPATGLRARMTWFWLNWYATPVSAIGNDWLLMYKQYYIIWTKALGNYRTLARTMFKDAALRKSLDQFEEVECGTVPIENFAREWFERFTVGLMAHNEGDIKRLSKGLMNCKDDVESQNLDLMTAGMIFTNTSEVLWTVTEAEQNLIVDRILDFKFPGEPPAAAQFLCGKLYGEFGVLPKSDTLSAAGFPPEVVHCANFLYDHNYDPLYALTSIFEDKKHFLSTLGKKKRWPMAAIIGPIIDLDLMGSYSTNWVYQKLSNVGMPPFEPQDVSGFDLDNVWTLDRLTKAHEFAEEISEKAEKRSADKSYFEDVETMTAKLTPFNLGPSQPTKYSYSVRVCGPDFFVETKGKEGNQTIDSTLFAEMGSTTSERYDAWKASVKFSLMNVCQFVC